MKITKDSFALPGLLVGLIILIGILVYLGNESKRLAHENPVVLDSISSNVNHTVPAIPVKWIRPVRQTKTRRDRTGFLWTLTPL